MNTNESPMYRTPILLKGYNPQFNPGSENPDADYKMAKAPTPQSKGYTNADYKVPSIESVAACVATGGWVGHLVPPGHHVLDVEDPYKIRLILDLCKRRGLMPPINHTNNGVHFVFKKKDGTTIPGADGRTTRMGFTVTDRSAGKNYVILPPMNGRRWENEDQLFDPPLLPDELLPAEDTIPDTMRALAWELGDAYRKEMLSGYDEVDVGFMALLVLCKCTDEQIGEAFELIFLEDFDESRTRDMLKRTKQRIEKGESLRGVGSLVQSLNDKGLKETVALVAKMQRLAGAPDKPFSDTMSCESWSAPIPFNDYSCLPSFPVAAIPRACGQMVAALADSCQVDTGLPGTMMLAILSAALGGRVKVNLGTHSEGVNIYAIAIVGSGNRKSEVVSQLAEPVYAYQRDRQGALAPLIRMAENKRRILEKRLEKLQKAAAGIGDPTEREVQVRACDDVLREMEANPVPPQQVFLVDDVTPEALGQIMADNGERVAILSAEGGLFRIIGGLYHNGQANIDLFLKAFSGDYWSNNRIGRDSKSMERPTLTLGLAVQPDVVEEIGQNSEFRGRGLSARFMYSACQSKAGYRTRQSAPVPPEIKGAYHERIVELMGNQGQVELSLAPGAQARWDEYYDGCERSLRPGAGLEHLVDWGSKLPGAVARIAGLLHFADIADGLPGNEIQERTVISACEIGSYYLQHAKAVFGMMKEDSAITMAKKILNYIKTNKPNKFKGRDLFNHMNCQSMQEVQPGLNNLLERGFIRETGRPEHEKRPGRPQGATYEVNPKIFSDS